MTVPTPVKYGYLGLCDGTRLNILNPDPAMMTPHIIANSISKLCRFGGQIQGNDIYSVAQHSWFVSMIVPKKDAFAGLMHDATEAFCVDMPRPIKEFLTGYAEFEARLWKSLCIRYDLPLKLPASVKLADNIAVITEAKAFTTGNDWKTWFPELTPHPGMLYCMTPKRAKQVWLDRFQKLSGEPIC